jgi:hypothetical protein
MLTTTLVTNDTEKSFVYEENGLRWNLSKLVAAGESPECYCIAAYNDEQYEPVVEVKIPAIRKELLQQWINL